MIKKTIVLFALILGFGLIRNPKHVYAQSCGGSVNSGSYDTYDCVPNFPAGMADCVKTIHAVTGACSLKGGPSVCGSAGDCGVCAPAGQMCVPLTASTCDKVILPGGSGCGGNDRLYSSGCSCSFASPTNTPAPTSTPQPGTMWCGNCDNSTCILGNPTQCAGVGDTDGNGSCSGNCGGPVPTTPPSDNPAIGWHDGPGSCVLNGWACDPDNYAQALTVNFIEGANLVGSTVANVPAEAGVSGSCGGFANHRFNGYSVPNSLRDGLAHSIQARAVGTTGIDTILSGNPQSVTCTPTCNAATITPSVTTTCGNSGTYTVTVSGVSAANVKFPTWTTVGGQDDIVWYQGVDLGGGVWRATIDLASHPGDGTINTHVWMGSTAGASTTFCGATTVTRETIPATAPTFLTPPVPLTCGNSVVSMTWTAPAGAWKYNLRIDDTSNPWVGSCIARQNAGDVCVDDRIGNGYTKNIVADGRVYNAWVHGCNSCGCGSPGALSFSSSVCPPPGCSITSFPAISGRVGNPPGTMTATVVPNAGSTVNGVDFTTTFPGATAFSVTTPDNLTPYSTTLTWLAAGIGSVRATARVSNILGQTGTCTTSSIVSVSPQFTSFFGTRGGDVVAAGGQLGTTLPVSPDPVRYLSDEADGFPGVAYGNGWFGNLSSSNVTQNKQWLIDIGSGWGGLVSSQQNTYQALRERALSKGQTTVSLVPGPGGKVDPTAFVNLIDSAPPTAKVSGIVIMRKTASGSLRFMDGEFNLGSRKVLLLVDTGNVVIGDKMFTDNIGLLAILAHDDIQVSGTVGESDSLVDIGGAGYAPHLKGIFYTQGAFDAGSSTNKLRIDGSVIGMNGVDMSGRTYAGLDPAVYVSFSPQLTYELGRVGLRKKISQEMVAP